MIMVIQSRVINAVSCFPYSYSCFGDKLPFTIFILYVTGILCVQHDTRRSPQQQVLMWTHAINRKKISRYLEEYRVFLPYVWVR